MSDSGPSNQQIAVAEGKSGHGRIVSGIIAGAITSYLMNQASLHGINFELLGVSSEIVKSSIDGTLVGIIVGITPAHFVAAVTDGIIFIKTTWKQWVTAWNTN